MLDEKICPICQEPNGCDSSSEKCWCYTIEIPRGLLARVPEELKGQACICKKCIEAYRLEKGI